MVKISSQHLIMAFWLGEMRLSSNGLTPACARGSGNETGGSGTEYGECVSGAVVGLTTGCSPAVGWW